MTPQLLIEIARCPEVNQCLMGNADHPCASIVKYQGINTTRDFQVPEPWSGQIQSAPILFISSNPSIGEDEIFPRGSWSNEDIVDFFHFRFGEGIKPWIVNGTKSLRKDGSYGQWTRFWAGVKGRARELLEREPIPGVDYALTELVHCKSRQELGITEALEQCVDLYLWEVLRASGAKVLVGLGSLAKEILCREFNLPSDQNVIRPMEICGRERMITFLPHPNAWQDKTFGKVITKSELTELRNHLLQGET